MRESIPGRVRRSLAEWRTICERFARSGLEVAEFCSREKLTISSFKKWYRRCRAEEQQGSQFIELVPPRLWKRHFAATPLCSDLDRLGP